MPLIKSAKKRVRVAARKQKINQIQRIGAKTAVRLATNAVAIKDDQAGKLATIAGSRLDRAAQKGTIHPNKASRLKSRLAAKLKAASIAPQAAAPKAPKAAKSATPKTKAAAKKTATKKPAK
jgi:small subunit ribosomal protein S20